MLDRNRYNQIKQIRDAKYLQAQSEKLGMSWFLFTINFKLFVGILSYVFDLVFVVESGADEETLVLTGILCVLFSAINLYVRHSLSCFYQNSLKLYFIAMYAVPIICNVFIAFVTGDVSSLSNTIALLIYIIPEFIYYHKRSHLFDVAIKKENFKDMKISNKMKAIVIGILYALVIFTQFAAFTPYTETETYISLQNVKNTALVERGYAPFDEADAPVFSNKKGVTAKRQINYTRFTFQLVMTTALAVFVYYFWCHKKCTPIVNNTSDEQETIKKQNIQLQQAIDILVDRNNKIELENKALKKQITQLYSYCGEAGTETNNTSAYEQLSFDDVMGGEPPYLDINGLAFADDETIKKAQKQYAEDLYKYFKAKDNGKQ